MIARRILGLAALLVIICAGVTACLFSDNTLPADPSVDRIAFLAESSSPGLSALFMKNNIYIMNIDRTGLTPLIEASNVIGWELALSPHGDKIAYFDYETNSLYLIKTDGFGQSELLGHPIDFLHPAWSPEDTKIAFSDSISIYLVDLVTGQVNQLTDTTILADTPAWSPDGNRIAFTLNPNLHDNLPDSSIAMINIDGSGFLQLTPNNKSTSPDWSPDGSQIMFHRTGNIYVMNADGTDVKALTQDGENFTSSWSPDGSQIVFEKRGNIYVMNADGTGVKALSQDGENHAPAWSPEGTRIAFVSTANQQCGGSSFIITDAPNFCTSELHVMNPDGSNLVVIWNKKNTNVIDMVWVPRN